MRLLNASLLGLLACSLPPVLAVNPLQRGPAPFPVTRMALAATLASSTWPADRPAFVPDSLIMSAGWVNPVDDGRGAIDSLRLRYVGIFLDTFVVFRAPFPVSSTLRQAIPAAAYSGISATYPNIHVEMQVWRRNAFANSTSNMVSITLLDSAPPPVTGLNFTAVKKP